MFNFISDFLPRYCLSCKKNYLASFSDILCDDCLEQCRRYPHHCFSCSQVLTKDEFCGFCILKKNPLDFFSTVFAYEEVVRDVVLQSKFFANKSALNFITNHMLQLTIEKLDVLNKYDLLIPLPISSSRLAYRGFNQTHYPAKKIAELLQKKIIKNIIFHRKTTPQSEIKNYQQRRKNVQNAFYMDLKYQSKIDAKSILLIDDVYTTGATAQELAKVLKRAGAKKVGVLTFAAVNKLDN